MRLFYLAIGWIGVGLALIGLFLPVFPTVPFLLIALWAFGHSSERLKQRLLNDPHFGPDIRRWQENHAIRPSVKAFSVLAMAGSILISIAVKAPVWAIITQAIILTAVSIYIVTRANE
ncbi:MAG: YbaN family protein [Paracoccus sp. (in: a-proteobacteria)]